MYHICLSYIYLYIYIYTYQRGRRERERGQFAAGPASARTQAHMDFSGVFLGFIGSPFLRSLEPNIFRRKAF